MRSALRRGRRSLSRGEKQQSELGGLRCRASSKASILGDGEKPLGFPRNALADLGLSRCRGMQ
jgi:hypothetical protein